MLCYEGLLLRTKEGQLLEAAFVGLRYREAGREVMQCHLHDMTARRRKQTASRRAQEQTARQTAELYDALGSKLAGISLLNQALAESLAGKSLPESSAANNITRLIQETVALSRSLVHKFIPPDVSPTKLGARLRQLATETELEWGVPCRAQVRRADRIQTDLQATHLLRIAEQAVSNAVSRDHAGGITIKLMGSDQEIRLEIVEDGSRADHRNRSWSGWGLGSMRYCSELIGGRLELQKKPGLGRIVACSIDLRGRDLEGPALSGSLSTIHPKAHRHQKVA
jgi:two-component system sensor histidine kinase UhpB